MAHNISFLKLTTILCLLLLHSQQAMTSQTEDMDDEDDIYILHHKPSSSSSSLRSRFLTRMIKKGTHCDNSTGYVNICNGVTASKGRGLLFCCKNHCRNVLSDKNNCGRCGHRCRQGQRCCDGACTDVLFNENHCGKCGNKCSLGVHCENGFCGYA